MIAMAVTSCVLIAAALALGATKPTAEPLKVRVSKIPRLIKNS